MDPSRVGRYVASRVLSKGAEEEVLLGEHGPRRVAIRLLHGSDRAGLQQDAQRISGLSHENVAHQEVGLHEGAPFIAADLDGQLLRDWLSQDHSLSERLHVVAGIAAGMRHAHAHEVVHGRLSPDWIAVAGDGAARIWGFAVRGSRPARTDAVYVAPEILEGGPATERADVYSVGVLCHEVLAGEASEGETPPSLREVRRELPRDVADAVMACRERAADWRPDDLDYLIEAVTRARGAHPSEERKGGHRAPATPVAPPRRRRGVSPWLSAVGALVVLGAGAALMLRRGGGSVPSAAPTTTLAPTPPAPVTAPAPPSSTAPKTASSPPAPVATQTPTPTVRPPATQPETEEARPKPAPPPTSAVKPPPELVVPSIEPAPVRPEEPPPAPASTTLPAATGPAAIQTLSPPTLRRGQRTLLDVRGRNLYPGLRAAVLRDGRPSGAVRTQQQRVVSSALLQVLIEIDATAPPGAYVLALTDGQTVTNSLRLEISK